MRVTPGSTSVILPPFPILKSDGTDATAFVAATVSAFTYCRAGGSPQTVTASNLASATAAYSSGGIYLVGNGQLRVDLPDAAFAVGASSVTIRILGTGGEVLCAPVIPLDDAVSSRLATSGYTAPDNASAAAAASSAATAATQATAAVTAIGTMLDRVPHVIQFSQIGGAGAYFVQAITSDSTAIPDRDGVIQAVWATEFRTETGDPLTAGAMLANGYDHLMLSVMPLINLAEDGFTGTSFTTAALANAPITEFPATAPIYWISAESFANDAAALVQNVATWRGDQPDPLVDGMVPVNVDVNAESIASAVWDRMTSAITTAGSIGQLIIQKLGSIGAGTFRAYGPMFADGQFAIIQGDTTTLSWGDIPWTRGTPTTCVVRIQKKSKWSSSAVQGPALLELTGSAAIVNNVLTVSATITAEQSASLPWESRLVASATLTYGSLVFTPVAESYGRVIRKVGD